MIIFLILAVLCCIYGIIILSGGSGTGFWVIWFAIAGILGALAFVIRNNLWSKMPLGFRVCMLVIFGVFLLSFLVIEGCIISRMNTQSEPGLDYIIVLGAQVRENGPSVVLQYRLDAAIDYLEDNPDTICIVSGGQGANEPFSEAQGMADYLEKKDISKERILLETESKTTAQNISYSMKMLPEGVHVGIVTNNFHMFRALQIAKKQGLTQVSGIAAASKPLYLPNNMLREYLAEIKWLLK